MLGLSLLMMYSVVMGRRRRRVQELALSSLLDFIQGPQAGIKQAVLGTSQCVLILESGQRLGARWPTGAMPALEDVWRSLRKAGVTIIAEPSTGNPALAFSVLCMAAYVFMLYTMFQRMKGGGSSPKSWTDARKKVLQAQDEGSDAIVSRFSDVAGIDGAKLQVKEIVDMLRNPSSYSSLGARVPRGVLLVGPPGSGKTLLARACAAEAGLPFLSAAATEFVELFVGRGAARVRSLFQRAEKLAPCIVFIDEVDALRARGNDLLRSGGNQEAEQTLNQLLASMDGLTARAGGKPVVVVGATNRPEVLDEALLRPGRFDRVVQVGLPDAGGRLAILHVHLRLKSVPRGRDADEEYLRQLAIRCDGFAGAALEALVNEAAIRAARRRASVVNVVDFESAFADYSSSRRSVKPKPAFPWAS